MTNTNFPIYTKFVDWETEDQVYYRTDKCDHHGCPFVEDRIVLRGDWEVNTHRFYCASLQIFPKAVESTKEEFEQARLKAIEILGNFV